RRAAAHGESHARRPHAVHRPRDPGANQLPGTYRSPDGDEPARPGRCARFGMWRGWRWGESNLRPRAYGTPAPPLSYTAVLVAPLARGGGGTKRSPDRGCSAPSLPHGTDVALYPAWLRLDTLDPFVIIGSSSSPRRRGAPTTCVLPISRRRFH